ncbi:MAG: CHAP domain-containing protein [Patescibacteria group bacterium]|nr:CHAP domain-containing protein [Patescibacteria group bacterium]
MFSPIPTSASPQDELNNLNQQINDLNKQISAKQDEKITLQSEIDLASNLIDQANLQIQATNTEIGIIGNDIVGINKEIDKKEIELKKQRDQLKEYLVVIYEEGQTSTLELVVRSSNFSDFVDRSEYLQTIQSKIKESADRIDRLRQELEDRKTILKEKKAKAEQLKSSQLAQRNAWAEQKIYKDNLLAQTTGQQKAFQKQVSDLYARKAALSAQFGEGINRGSSAYPYGNPPATNLIDTADNYGYLIGECTSYAAWKRTSVGRPIPRNLGNANTWGINAAAQGQRVDRTPEAGSVIVMPYVGGYGHVAYVEAVYNNGTVLISEYNWIPYSYSTRIVNPYNYGASFIH